MGKKQLAVLLLVYLLKSTNTKQLRTVMGMGTYNTLQTVMHKLHLKGYLDVVRVDDVNFYSTNEKGQHVLWPIVKCLCENCVTVELARALYL